MIIYFRLKIVLGRNRKNLMFMTNKCITHMWKISLRKNKLIVNYGRINTCLISRLKRLVMRKIMVMRIRII